MLAAIVALLPIIAALRELSVQSKSDREIVVRGRGDKDTLWYTFALGDANVPTLTIRGSKDDAAGREGGKDAVEEVQYVVAGVRETAANGASFGTDAMAGASVSLQLVKATAGVVEMEAVIEHAREKDVAGNKYALEILAKIDGRASEADAADGVTIRTSVCNFPYRYGPSGATAERSKLVVEQVFAASGARAGRIDVDVHSARDDGNPGTLGYVQQSRAEAKPGQLTVAAKDAEVVKVEFYSNRPKKAVFTELLTLHSKNLPEAENGRNIDASSKESADMEKAKVDQQSANGGARANMSVAVAALFLVAVML